MRINLKELCGIDSIELRTLTHPEASKKIIDACIAEKDRLAIELNYIITNDKDGYEELSAINYKIMYLDRAINSRTQDYEEMML